MSGAQKKNPHMILRNVAITQTATLLELQPSSQKGGVQHWECQDEAYEDLTIKYPLGQPVTLSSPAIASHNLETDTQ